MLKQSLLAISLLAGMSTNAAQGGLLKAKDHINYKFGGRLMLDGAYYDDDKTDLQSGTEVRRARLYFAGVLKKNWDFIVQIDYAGNKTTIKEAHIAYSWEKSVLSIGNMLPPFSLQLQTSSKWQTFVTRSLPVLALNPDSSFGLSYKYSANNYFFKTGIYGGTSAENTERERFIFAMRGATLKKFGSSLNHFGLSYLHVAREDQAAFKSSNETHVDSYDFVSTNQIDNRQSDRLALEYALVAKSFSTQAEYFLVDVRGKGGIQDTISGWYAFMSWFPTGDTRSYSINSAAFGEVMPRKEFGETGIGAIELALRYSNIDFTGSLNGGEQNNIAAEINWYPGGGLKFMLNQTFVNAEKNGVKDKPSITQFRAQVTF